MRLVPNWLRSGAPGLQNVARNVWRAQSCTRLWFCGHAALGCVAQPQPATGCVIDAAAALPHHNDTFPFAHHGASPRSVARAARMRRSGDRAKAAARALTQAGADAAGDTSRSAAPWRPQGATALQWCSDDARTPPPSRIAARNGRRAPARAHPPASECSCQPTRHGPQDGLGLDARCFPPAARSPTPAPAPPAGRPRCG